MAITDSVPATNFIHHIIDEDLKNHKNDGRVITRFPPEPNGYLHIGHAKSICLNFGLAADYHGVCNLRFDDTNPSKEEVEYVDSIMADVRWVGFDWEDRLFFASDYFEQLYQYALHLIQTGKAYVCDLSPEQVREYRGTLTEPGADSPFRHRSVAENLDLFQRMRAGEFPDGSRTLRAKIDMASPNLNMRDPVLYRIKHESHHRTGDAWCIYPMYDYAHPLSDALEGITHSICTMEYEDHRVLYDWCLDHCPVPCHPQQYRVRPPQPQLHRHEQAQAPATGERGARGRLGRPPHAHPGGDAAPGLHPGGHPHFLRAHRGGETGEPGGPGPAGILRPGRLELPGAPGDGGAETPQGGPGQLPGGPGGGARGREQPRGLEPGHPDGAVLPGAVYRSARTSWRTRPRNSTAWPPGGRCGCATPTSSSAKRWSRTP